MVTDTEVREALRTVIDPEIGADIVGLGLVREIAVGAAGDVDVRMTLTSRGCPLGPVILQGVGEAVKRVPGVSNVTVDLVWEPAWTPDSIEPETRKALQGY